MMDQKHIKFFPKESKNENNNNKKKNILMFTLTFDLTKPITANKSIIIPT